MAKLDVLLAEYTHDLSREAAAWGVRASLHEEHDMVLSHQRLQPALQLFRRLRVVFDIFFV